MWRPCLLVVAAGCGRAGFERVQPASDATLADASSDGAAADGASVDAGAFQCGDGVDAGTGAIPTVAIGAQCWLAANLGVGTTIAGSATPANNGVIERVCYDDLAASCVSGGGLYEWSEAMAGAVAEGSRGICPAGWHIPSDAEWQVLEATLGMQAAEITMFGYRGGTAGNLLRPGGTGFDATYVGVRTDTGGFLFGSTQVTYWSSTEGLAGANGVVRSLSATSSGIERYGYDKNNAFSVRCVMD